MSGIAGRQDDAPIPADVPRHAPLFSDPETPLEGKRHHSSDELTLYDGKKSRASSTKNVRDSNHEREKGKGLTEGDADMMPIPENNLWIVIPCLSLLLFVACMDMTIVVTALPTIAEDLHLSPSGYQWVGTAYLLGNAAFTPFYGRVSDITGRKPMLYAMTIMFMAFSAMCGFAQDEKTMIIGRAFQGAGGGAIIVVSMIIIADITPLATRTIYLGLMNSSVTVANVIGPVIGGALAEKSSWRWCFWINLPTCAIGVGLVGFTLRLNPTKHTGLQELLRTFDFLGFFLIVSGVALSVVGFAVAADGGFGSPLSYSMIIVGVLLTIGAVTNFIFTKRIPVIPPRLFQIRTTALFLIAAFFQALAFLSTMFLLPQLFQALRGATPLQAGIDIIPFCVIVSILMASSGWFISKDYRVIRPMAWAGYSISALGFLLFYIFYTSTASYGVLLGLQFITGFGIGLSIQPQLIAMQAAMPLREVGAVTSAYMLARPIGATIGLAIDQAVLNTGIRSRFEGIPGYGTVFEAPTNEAGYKALHALPEGEIKNQVMAAFADSMKLCWLIHMAVLLAALLLTIPTRAYRLDRQQGTAASAPSTGAATAPSSPTDAVTKADTGAPDLEKNDMAANQPSSAIAVASANAQAPRPPPLTRSASRVSAVGVALTKVASAVGTRPLGPFGTGASAAIAEEESRRREDTHRRTTASITES